MLLRCWAKLVVTVVTREAGTTRQHHDVPLKEASLASRLCWSDLTIVLTALGNPIPFLYLCCLFLLISWTSIVDCRDLYRLCGSACSSRASTNFTGWELRGKTVAPRMARLNDTRSFFVASSPSLTDDDAYAYVGTLRRRQTEDVAPLRLRRHRWSSASANLSKLGQPAQVA